jgi:acetyl-CoA synthetase
VNPITDLLERYPASKPALVAIARDGARRVWHFGELIARSAGLSGALAARGVGRGDCVMTLAGNRVEWVLALLACWRMGAVALPCNTQLRRKDLELRVAAVAADRGIGGEGRGPALCVGEEDLLEALPGGVDAMTMADVDAVLDEDQPQETPAAVASLDPSEPALLVFTSGTTGEPRGALHSQRYLPAQRAQAEHWLGAADGDLVWVTTATGWSKSARNVFLAPWLCGAAALIDDSRFEPERRLELCEREGVNVLCQAPTEYRMLAKRTELRRLPQMRRLVSAGEPLNPEVVVAFAQELGLDISDGYGQTETGHLTGTAPGEATRPGSMGRALPGFDTRIAEGMLEVRVASCPTFFSRYLGSEPFAGEWWSTGDAVLEDPDGYLWFQGRDDDLILSAGYRIGPFEVESALLGHRSVAEAAAVGAPDEERGQVVKAVVVLRDGHEPSDALAAELQEYVKAETAPYKFPRIVEFADELPKTASGKIRRAELR